MGGGGRRKREEKKEKGTARSPRCRRLLPPLPSPLLILLLQLKQSRLGNWALDYGGCCRVQRRCGTMIGSETRDTPELMPLEAEAIAVL